jgi:hypothetical protein
VGVRGSSLPLGVVLVRQRDAAGTITIALNDKLGLKLAPGDLLKIRAVPGGFTAIRVRLVEDAR